MKLTAFVLAGPTGTGKSDVALSIAQREGWFILSADSMMVYRGMDIGTAKPSQAARARVPHDGLDLVDAGEGFSAGRFREFALEALAKRAEAGGTSIVVGGTGLYIKALVCGLRPAATDPATRTRLRESLQRGGVDALGDELRRLDPAAYAALSDVRNPRRVMRALERAASGARDGDEWKETPWRGGPAVCLWVDPDELRRRIARRTAAMFDGGFLEEVRRLIAAEALSDTAREAIGYAEAIACLTARCTKEEAVQRTVLRTCQLAKRQRTWFRHQMPVQWVDATEMDTARAADAVLASWREHGPTVIRSGD